MSLVLLFLIISCAAHTVFGAAATVVHVKDGFLQPDNTPVGTYTSDLQSNVVDKLFAPIPDINELLSNVSLVNASVLRYLYLEGHYYADVPLQIPSLFVLKLNGTLTDAQNLSLSNINSEENVKEDYDQRVHTKTWPRFSALVVMNHSKYSAVDGGTYNATVFNSTNVMAVTMLNSFDCSVRNIRANALYDGAIGVNGGSRNEIAHCEAGGFEGRMSPTRAIWALATSQVYVYYSQYHC